MDVRIDDTPRGLAIHVEGIGTQQKQLMEAFQACQEGRCACPTDEYQKLASMRIEAGDDRVSLQLEARPGQQLQRSEVERCLKFTEEQLRSRES